MKKYVFIFMALIGLTSFKAGSARSIGGTVFSAFDNSILVGVAIKVIGATIQTNTDIKGQYRISVPKGKTQLVFSLIGYKSDTINLSNSSVINVHLEKNRQYTHKTDTVQFRASDYKVRSNTSIKPLLKRMEGLQVNADGSVSQQGQPITKVRINGKDFAGSNAQAAIKNLPSEIIDKIQVMDDYGDQANVTGVKTGNPNKVLGIITKNNTAPVNSSGELHEVVVTGYGTQKKVDVTGSVISIPGEQKVEAQLSVNNMFYRKPVLVNPGTESYSRIVENNFEDAKTTPLSTFAVDVDAASYANVRRFINAGQLPPKNAVRIEGLVNYFHYDLPAPTNGEPVAIQTEMSAAPWNPQHELVRIGLKAKEVKMDKLPPSNLVFLLDVSGDERTK